MTTHLQPKPAGTPTWTDLTSPDAEAARNFYQAVFGWSYDVGGPEFGGYTTARLGERSTVGFVGNQPDMPPMPAAWGHLDRSHWRPIQLVAGGHARGLANDE